MTVRSLLAASSPRSAGGTRLGGPPVAPRRSRRAARSSRAAGSPSRPRWSSSRD